MLAVLTGVGDDASVAGRVLDEMLAHRLHHARRNSDTSCRSSDAVSNVSAPHPARHASLHSLCCVASVAIVQRLRLLSIGEKHGLLHNTVTPTSTVAGSSHICS